MFQLRFIGLAIWTNFRLALALRTAFFITIVVTILKQSLLLVTWNFFFAKYKEVQGWDFNDMLLMYGIVCFAFGIIEMLFDGLRILPRLIDSGQLDSFLLQPKNVILNIALSKGDFSALGEIITGLIVIGYSGYWFKAWPLCILLLLIAALFVFSLHLYLSCIAFFMRNAHDFIRELVLNALIVASQPNVAYRGAFKIFTFTILPVAYLSYLPVETLRTGSLVYLGWTLFGTIIFFAVSVMFFKFGLRHYESGSMLALRN